MQQSQQPGIGLAIQHQVNALPWPRVIHPMRPGQVDEPALAGLHGNLQAIDEKVHTRRAQQWHMQAQVTVRLPQVGIAMFVDTRAAAQAQQAGAAYGRLEAIQQRMPGRFCLPPAGVYRCTLTGSQGLRGILRCDQIDTAAVALVVAPIEMTAPGSGGDA